MGLSDSMWRARVGVIKPASPYPLRMRPRARCRHDYLSWRSVAAPRGAADPHGDLLIPPPAGSRSSPLARRHAPAPPPPRPPPPAVFTEDGIRLRSSESFQHPDYDRLVPEEDPTALHREWGKRGKGGEGGGEGEGGPGTGATPTARGRPATRRGEKPGEGKRGRLVAVKVQYPGALDRMLIDLVQIRRFSRLLSRDLNFDVTSAVDELARQVRARTRG